MRYFSHIYNDLYNRESGDRAHTSLTSDADPSGPGGRYPGADGPRGGYLRHVKRKINYPHNNIPPEGENQENKENVRELEFNLGLDLICLIKISIVYN